MGSKVNLSMVIYCSHNVNMGSPKLVYHDETDQYGDGVLIVSDCCAVTSAAIGIQSNRCGEYKMLATTSKPRSAGGKENSFWFPLKSLKEDC